MCTSLTALYCSGNQLTVLDVSANTALRWLFCDNNQLTELDVSGCTALEALYCGGQTSDGTTPQTLTLTLTADQKTQWDNEWSTDEEFNKNVELKVK